MVRLPSGKVVINDAEANLVDAELGLVSYVPEAAEVAQDGRHAVYFLDQTDEVEKRWPYDGAKYVLNIKPEVNQ